MEPSNEEDGNNLPVIPEEECHYGGDFPWVGRTYRLYVKAGLSPLRWINYMAKWSLSLSNLRFAADGGFLRPGDGQSAFPIGGVDLRWRYDEQRSRIVIDFFGKNGMPLEWRWDELKVQQPGECSFGAAGDLLGVGHVGKMTYDYRLERLVGPVSRTVTPWASLVESTTAGSPLASPDVRPIDGEHMFAADSAESLFTLSSDPADSLLEFSEQEGWSLFVISEPEADKGWSRSKGQGPATHDEADDVSTSPRESVFGISEFSSDDNSWKRGLSSGSESSRLQDGTGMYDNAEDLAL